MLCDAWDGASHLSVNKTILGFVLQVTNLIVQYMKFCKFIKIYVGYNLCFSKFTPW